MESNQVLQLPSCCNKHITKMKKKKFKSFELECSTCHKIYFVELIVDTDLNAGESDWKHPVELKHTRAS